MIKLLPFLFSLLDILNSLYKKYSPICWFDRNIRRQLRRDEFLHLYWTEPRTLIDVIWNWLQSSILYLLHNVLFTAFNIASSWFINDKFIIDLFQNFPFFVKLDRIEKLFSTFRWRRFVFSINSFEVNRFSIFLLNALLLIILVQLFAKSASVPFMNSSTNSSSLKAPQETTSEASKGTASFIVFFYNWMLFTGF